MDMALETELGVDSIKRVEILSDVQKELDVEAQDAATARTQTEVVEAMIAELRNVGGGGSAPAPRHPQPRRAAAAAVAAAAFGRVC